MTKYLEINEQVRGFLEEISSGNHGEHILAEIRRLRKKFKKIWHIRELQRIAEGVEKGKIGAKGYSYEFSEDEWWDAMKKLLVQHPNRVSRVSPSLKNAVYGMNEIFKVAPDWVDKNQYPRNCGETEEE